MPTTAQLSHHLTKHPLIDSVLTWIQHRDIAANDMFVASYPRSGSTWLRFILCELLTGQETSFELVDEQLAGIGHHQKANRLLPNGGRLLKTHEPYRSAYQRAIYIVRDVRDVVLSEYVFCRRERYFAGTFEDFLEMFLQGKVNRYGFWGSHVQSWLNFAEQQPEQVLVIRFEDFKRETADVIRHCLDLLGVERSNEQISQAVENHNLVHMKQKEDKAEKFRNNAEGLRFITDGASGKGKQQLSQEQMERLVTATQPVLSQLGYL